MRFAVKSSSTSFDNSFREHLKALSNDKLVNHIVCELTFNSFPNRIIINFRKYFNFEHF